MKIQSIMPTIKQNVFGNSNSVNNRPSFRQRNLTCDVYETNMSKVSFGSLPNNFGEVIEGKLFRGAAPVAENIEALVAKGITHIIDLVESPVSEGLAKQAGISYKNLPTEQIAILDSAGNKLNQIKQAIDEALAAGKTVYIHCDKGETRTGLSVAYYQMKSGVPIKDVQSQYSFHKGHGPLFELLKYIVN